MTSPPTPPTKTVLLIDNDEGVLAALSTRLRCSGYDCITAQTGAQGLAKFDPGRVDLIITDLNMAVLDGIGVVEKIREESLVPIMIVTGFRDEYTADIAKMQNVAVYEKPFCIDALIAQIEADVFLDRGREAA